MKLLSVKFVCVKFVCVKLLYVKFVCVKFVCVKLLSVKFVCVKFVCVKLLYVKFVCVKLLYVKFVCVKLLSVKFVCVKFVCVKFVCVKLLYVKFVCVVLRRRREEEEKPGIQNQKQEPHTKMWGKKDKKGLGIEQTHKKWWQYVRLNWRIEAKQNISFDPVTMLLSAGKNADPNSGPSNILLVGLWGVCTHLPPVPAPPWDVPKLL